MEQEEKTGLVELDDVFVRPVPDSVPKSRHTSNGSVREPTVKVEDEDEQPQPPIHYKPIHVGGAPAMNVGERKRKAAVDIGTENGRNKRVTRSESRRASQQASRVASEVSQHSSSEAPADANRGPTPAAHIYRNETGVFVRPKTGWQFREFEGTTKVWYNGKWRPLIQDQPSFKGVRRAKGGWIVPMMAASKEASLEQRRRWELQGRVEFNSPF